MARFRLTGVKEMRKKIERLAKRVPDQIDGAVFREGERIMARSKREFVPVDLGSLRASGRVGLPVRKGRMVTVALVYGNTAAPYALAVHEHPSSHSPPSWQGVPVKFRPTGRGPKYLELPLMEAIPGMTDRIGKEIKL